MLWRRRRSGWKEMDRFGRSQKRIIISLFVAFLVFRRSCSAGPTGLQTAEHS